MPPQWPSYPPPVWPEPEPEPEQAPEPEALSPEREAQPEAEPEGTEGAEAEAAHDEALAEPETQSEPEQELAPEEAVEPELATSEVEGPDPDSSGEAQQEREPRQYRRRRSDDPTNRPPGLLRNAMMERQKIDESMREKSAEVLGYLSRMAQEALPPEKRERLYNADTVLKVEALRHRLSGKGGLLALTESVPRAPSPAEKAQSARPRPTVTETLSYLQTLASRHLDPIVAGALQQRLQRVASRSATADSTE